MTQVEVTSDLAVQSDELSASLKTIAAKLETLLSQFKYRLSVHGKSERTDLETSSIL